MQARFEPNVSRNIRLGEVKKVFASSNKLLLEGVNIPANTWILILSGFAVALIGVIAFVGSAGYAVFGASSKSGMLVYIVLSLIIVALGVGLAWFGYTNGVLINTGNPNIVPYVNGIRSPNANRIFPSQTVTAFVNEGVIAMEFAFEGFKTNSERGEGVPMNGKCIIPIQIKKSEACTPVTLIAMLDQTTGRTIATELQTSLAEDEYYVLKAKNLVADKSWQAQFGKLLASKTANNAIVCLEEGFSLSVLAGPREREEQEQEWAEKRDHIKALLASLNSVEKKASVSQEIRTSGLPAAEIKHNLGLLAKRLSELYFATFSLKLESRNITSKGVGDISDAIINVEMLDEHRSSLKKTIEDVRDIISQRESDELFVLSEAKRNELKVQIKGLTVQTIPQVAHAITTSGLAETEIEEFSVQYKAKCSTVLREDILKRSASESVTIETLNRLVEEVADSELLQKSDEDLLDKTLHRLITDFSARQENRRKDMLSAQKASAEETVVMVEKYVKSNQSVVESLAQKMGSDSKLMAAIALFSIQINSKKGIL